MIRRGGAVSATTPSHRSLSNRPRQIRPTTRVAKSRRRHTPRGSSSSAPAVPESGTALAGRAWSEAGSGRSLCVSRSAGVGARSRSSGHERSWRPPIGCRSPSTTFKPGRAVSTSRPVKRVTHRQSYGLTQASNSAPSSTGVWRLISPGSASRCPAAGRQSARRARSRRHTTALVGRPSGGSDGIAKAHVLACGPDCSRRRGGECSSCYCRSTSGIRCPSRGKKSSTPRSPSDTADRCRTSATSPVTCVGVRRRSRTLAAWAPPRGSSSS